MDGSGSVTLRNRQHLRKFVPFYERPNIDQAINTIPLPAPVTCESKLPDDPPSPVANLGKPPVIPVTQGSFEPPAKTKIIRRKKFQSEKGLIVRKYLFYKGGNARKTGRFVLICSLIIWSLSLVLGTVWLVVLSQLLDTEYHSYSHSSTRTSTYRHLAVNVPRTIPLDHRGGWAPSFWSRYWAWTLYFPSWCTFFFTRFSQWIVSKV